MQLLNKVGNLFPKMTQAIVALGVLAGASSAMAYPLLDVAVPSGGLPIKIYKDHAVPGVYYYIPQSIEPWSINDDYKSQVVYKKGKSITFVFRGQASVDADMLKQAAKAIGTKVDNLLPIAYDSSENLTCQNVYAADELTWAFPSKIGNYLEVVPVTLRSTNPNVVDEINELVTGGGLACIVDVTFKAVTTGYHVTMKADMNEVYTRFEAGFSASYMFFEVDLHTVIQKLIQDGVITIEKYEDPEYANTPLDQQVAASFDQIEQKVIELMFTPAPKLPAGGIPAASRPFSLRVDYQKSEMHKHYEADLDGKYVSKKTSSIGLRLATQ